MSAWTEHKAPDGRRYWFNKQLKKSTWKLPPELAVRDHEAATRKLFSEQRAFPADVSSAPSDAERAFWTALNDAGVGPEWSWESVVRLLVSDDRYTSITPPSRRRTSFEAFIAAKAAALRKERLRLDEWARDIYISALNETCDSENENCTSFKTAENALKGDARARVVAHAEDREGYFDEWLRKKEEKSRAEREEKVKAEREKVKKWVKDGELDVVEDVDLFLDHVNKRRKLDDMKDGESGSESENEVTAEQLEGAFIAYCECVREERNELEMKEAADMRRRDRIARDAFLSLLDRLFLENVIHRDMPWAVAKPIIVQHAEYQTLRGTPGSLPAELYLEWKSL